MQGQFEGHRRAHLLQAIQLPTSGQVAGKEQQRQMVLHMHAAEEEHAAVQEPHMCKGGLLLCCGLLKRGKGYQFSVFS
jgi:hypothetical protein